jgi:N-acetylglucosaminyldiphosphoundecaprenol N-acetyl-beta-D-mannosaminyltransferase
MGCAIDNLSMEETLQTVEGFIGTGEPHQHVVVNVDKLVKASRDPELRRIINDCALVNVDGMPVVWASRLLGKPLKERVAGVDLFEALMRRAGEKGWRVFLLGAQGRGGEQGGPTYQHKLSEAGAGRLPQRLLEGRGGRSAGGRADPRSQPDLLFVAISSPKKEQFLGRWQAEMKIPFAMGVGGTFDVAIGRVKRAPVWMQKSGLEWFYRFPAGAAPHVPPIFYRGHGLCLAVHQGSRVRRKVFAAIKKAEQGWRCRTPPTITSAA